LTSIWRSRKGQRSKWCRLSWSPSQKTYNSVKNSTLTFGDLWPRFEGHGKVRGQNDVVYRDPRPKKHIIASKTQRWPLVTFDLVLKVKERSEVKMITVIVLRVKNPSILMCHMWELLLKKLRGCAVPLGGRDRFRPLTNLTCVRRSYVDTRRQNWKKLNRSKVRAGTDRQTDRRTMSTH